MKDLTAGSVVRHLLSLAAMFALNLVTTTLFSLINLHWVGRMGATAQAAVALGAIPAMFLLMLLPVISVGAQVLIAQSVGAQDRDRANQVFNESLLAAVVVAVLVGGIGWIWRAELGGFLAGDAQTAQLIATYLSWFIPSAALQIPMIVLAGALESTGNVRTALIAQVATVMLNSALAPVLMFGWLGVPALGLSGAGLASFLSCAVAVLALVVYSARDGVYLSIKLASWFSRPLQLPKILRIGYPMAFSTGVMAIYTVVIMLVLRPYGAVEQAAFGIGWRVLQAALIPLMAMASALSVVAGQNYGAGLTARVRQGLYAGIGFGIAAAALMIALLEWLPGPIIQLFADDAETSAASVLMLRIVSVSLLPLAVANAASGVLNALGETAASLKSTLVYGALIVGLGWTLSQLSAFTPAWLWFVLVAASVGQAAAALYFVDSSLAAPAPDAAAPVAVAADPAAAEAALQPATGVAENRA